MFADINRREAEDQPLPSSPHRAVSSGGEHFLDAEGVRGSNPLPPTTNLLLHVPSVPAALLVRHEVRAGGRARRTVSGRAPPENRSRRRDLDITPERTRRATACCEAQTVSGSP